MISPDKPILVTGATGRQGGATAARLLEAGWPVRALVRDPDAPAAKALEAEGAELRAGNLDDPGSLAEAVAGVHGVFGVTPDDLEVEREVRRGRALVDAAAAAGVSHFVFASVGGAERGTGIPYWREQVADRAAHSRARPARDDPASGQVHGEPHHSGLPVGGIVDG
ncbi:NmrA family NAD(P)-binding protein [Nonomuraea dietziae]|uniref:NmrA family NAD(P)-binding protein n=1 Tax=Nonomuraea dietziae TaxID=65515 RepID=UPI0031E1E3A3